jgi:hypothetical protein
MGELGYTLRIGQKLVQGELLHDYADGKTYWKLEDDKIVMRSRPFATPREALSDSIPKVWETS